MAYAVQEKRFDYKGFPCVVLMQHMAFRTGYVGIPKGHKLYGVGYDGIGIDCHGGLTYSDKSLALQNDEDTWWIGFDTGHYCDGKDYEMAIKMFADDVAVLNGIMLCKKIDERFGTNTLPVRTLEYCEDQCKYIVDQILQEV